MRKLKYLLRFISLLAVPALQVYSQNAVIPVVTIHASDPFATWSGDSGTFSVFREGPTNETLNVFYRIGGTASNGVDYAMIDNWVTVLAGTRSNSISIKPIQNGQPNLATVELELTPSPLAILQNYIIGRPAAATVYITPADITNVPPYVRIFTPTNGEKFATSDDVRLGAFGTDANGYVATVEFFADDQSLGLVTNGAILDPPFPDGTGPGSRAFFLTWTNPTAGSHVLTAKATDNDGAWSISPEVKIMVIGETATNRPPVVKITEPPNGSAFFTPVDVGICASALDPDGFVSTVEFFAGDHSLGIKTNNPVSTGPRNPFCLTWSNVPPGSYKLTAMATDNEGATGRSEPVLIMVLEGPPPNQPPVVKITDPDQGSTFFTPTDVGICASALDPDGFVSTVEFFAGDHSLGIKTNNPVSTGPRNPFCLTWSNVPPGGYKLTAVATDNEGATGKSEPVLIMVLEGPPPNKPPVVRLTSPANGTIFRAPVNVPLYAYAFDHDGSIASVEFFAGDKSLGLGQGLCLRAVAGRDWPTNVCVTNYFVLIWSNAPPGEYALKAVATDNEGALGTSGPVKIAILTAPPPPTNRPAIVSVVATDPLAIEGTNCWPWLGLASATPTWQEWDGTGSVWRFFTNCGPNNGTFTIHRHGATNDDLTIEYEVGGTAISGVDYVPLLGSVVIPAGHRNADVVVVPLDDGRPDIASTVVLKLSRSTNYVVGFPPRAAVLILDSKRPHHGCVELSDHSFHLAAPGPDGAWFHVEYSTNLRDWSPICTNQVVNGSIDFVDPDAASDQSRFYRMVPETNPPQD